MSEITFADLDYGAYSIESIHSNVLTEAMRYASADFNKLYVQKVRLPDGKSNVIYLMAKSFDDCINMINGQNFMIPPIYRKIYYPVYYAGNFMGRRFRISLLNQQTERNKFIKEKTKLMPFIGRTLPKKITENIFFCCGDIYQALEPIMNKYPVKRNYETFFNELSSILGVITPKPLENDDKKVNNNRLMIIDCNSFQFDFSAQLKDNKTNPLFLMYLKYMRERSLEDIGIDMDMLICRDNLFLKFNPAKCDKKQYGIFKRALFRMIGGNLDTYTDALSDEEKSDLQLTSSSKIISNTIRNMVAPYTKMASVNTQMAVANAVESRIKEKAAETLAIHKATKEIQSAVAKASGTNNPEKNKNPMNRYSGVVNRNIAKNPLNSEDLKFFNQIIGGYHSLTTPTGQYIDDDESEEAYGDNMPEDDFGSKYGDSIENDVHDVLTDDEKVAAEVLDEIQSNVAPLNNPRTSPVNSARDKKLREEQKKVVVKTETIEEILSRDSTNVPIETDDKSSVLHTSNQNMKKITFTNFDKTYIDTLYTKDLVSCFDMLKDKNSPFYITNIEVKDTSDQLNYKETWTVSLKDELGKKHTIRVDIPKFIDDRFMLINGTRFMILKQNFYNPLVKDTPDTVILTTNFNKVTIDRTSSKSFGSVERIFSLIKKTGDTKVFTAGDSSRANSNTKYISSLEYDEISRRLFKFSSNNCEIYFSRDYLANTFATEIAKSGAKGNEFYIGHEGNYPILINEDTGLDRNGRTITDIIHDNLSDEYQMIYDKETKAPKQSMYVEAKLAGQMMPMVVTLIVWNGITKALDAIGTKWEFHPNMNRMPNQSTSTKYIKFLDGVLEYKSDLYAELILNGISVMHPEKFTFESFESEEGYGDYIRATFGTYAGLSRLNTFNEFLVDPITRDVCHDLFLPDTPTGLLIHAAKLLADNVYVSKASDKSFRVRSVEMIPGILYSCIANQYASYVNSGRKTPLTLRQNAVLSALMAEKTVEPYSTLNPVVEVGKMSTISTKGYRGSNSEMAYKSEEKRSYDQSSVGKLAMSTSADANVGVNRQLVVEPTIKNARGYRDPVDDVDALQDVNVFSPVEMLTPGTARNDDPIRTAIKEAGCRR